MQAIEVVMPGIGPPENLQIRQCSLPPPAAGEVLIQVGASGVSFAEQQMRRGRYFDHPKFPFVPGYDLVGKVVQVGPGTTSPLAERVAALTKTGGWASHVLLPAADLVRVPEGVDSEQAEAMIVNGLTAWRMLHGVAQVKAGETMVVLGANGGVGSTLVQLAGLAGIKVIGTASARNCSAVRSLGAIPVDYRDNPVDQVRRIAPHGVNAVFDHLAGEGLRSWWEVLGVGGRLVVYGVAAFLDATGDPMQPILDAVALLTELEKRDQRGRRAYFFNVWEGRDTDLEGFRARLQADLATVFELLRDGKIRGLVARRFPLQQAADAMRLAESGTITGKVILRPDLAVV